MNRRVRVLIVDDSATMRGLIAAMLRLDSAIDIVGEAGDAVEARRLIKELDPDVLTLDIEMPGMDGLEFLEKIMALRPMPVVIVSSATERAAATTVRALQAGAFECYAKPTGRVVDDMTLAGIVRAAAACPSRSAALRERRRPLSAPKPSGRLIAIGASTGGVETLLELLAGFPKDCPPTVIVQHMPATFTTSFALRLNRFCPPTVCEVESGTILEQGHVYLAPGGLRHMEVVGAAAPRVRLLEGAPVSGHRPSVDVLFSSIARLAVPAVGILLTGMGADGAAGLKKMRDAGARTIGQDQATSVVYGMPQAARLIGAVEQELALPHIASTALEMAA